MFQDYLRKTALAIATFAVLLLAACGSDPAQPPSAGVEPEILNNTDVFQFQVSSIQNYTRTFEYAWTNTGTLANVDQSSSIQPGQATLVLLDASGTEVYSKDLSTDGSTPTVEGSSGDWTIRVLLTSTTGTINFRAEKRTP